ncbi:MAG: hypothetical protein ACRD0H_30840 [Actinomycetes bacterium]
MVWAGDARLGDGVAVGAAEAPTPDPVGEVAADGAGVGVAAEEAARYTGAAGAR